MIKKAQRIVINPQDSVQDSDINSRKNSGIQKD